MKLQKKSKLIVTFFVVILIFSPTIFGLKIKQKKDEKKDLPSYFSWRESYEQDFTSSIKFLNPLPSCEITALCAAIETMVQYKVGYPFGCDLSEAHLFYCSGGTIDWGLYIEDALDYLVEYGVPDEACWPYPDEKKNYPLNTSCPNWKNRTVKIKSWRYLAEDKYEIKTALIENGPIVAYIDLYEDFLYHLSGVYEHRWGPCIGGHWVSIIGYNEEEGCWIGENSYGTQWGENGFFKIKYGECGIEKHMISLKDVYGNFPILYVDGNNIIGPRDGSKDNPYMKIQDAIDNAYLGWTVFVKKAKYSENIIINKSLNLDGENPYSTIIDGNKKDDVILIKSEDARISGFTIQNSGKNLFDSGIELRTWETEGFKLIKNNIFNNNRLGIYLHWAPNNIIHNNIFMQNDKGISLWNSYNNIIQNNVIIENNLSGIEFQFSTGYIINNHIENNSLGIYINENSCNNFIKFNNIENNNIGLLLSNKSKKNKVIKNHFINNEKQAFFLKSYPNIFLKNYWNDWNKKLPKKIKGKIGNRNTITFYSFDWIPSPEPLK